MLVGNLQVHGHHGHGCVNGVVNQGLQNSQLSHDGTEYNEAFRAYQKRMCLLQADPLAFVAEILADVYKHAVPGPTVPLFDTDVRGICRCRALTAVVFTPARMEGCGSLYKDDDTLTT